MRLRSPIISLSSYPMFVELQLLLKFLSWSFFQFTFCSIFYDSSKLSLAGVFSSTLYSFIEFVVRGLAYKQLLEGFSVFADPLDLWILYRFYDDGDGILLRVSFSESADASFLDYQISDYCSDSSLLDPELIEVVPASSKDGKKDAAIVPSSCITVTFKNFFPLNSTTPTLEPILTSNARTARMYFFLSILIAIDFEIGIYLEEYKGFKQFMWKSNFYRCFLKNYFCRNKVKGFF